MTNNLVFGWKPYSDAGEVKETQAWKKPNAPPSWCIMDKDGTKLPAYFAYTRSIEEVKRYHSRFNGLSVKRAPTSVAFYVSNDTNEYVSLETGNKPWDSPWQRTRNNLIYLLRLNGVSADYVDDAILPAAPGRFRQIVVPAAYVLSAGAAKKLASFTQGGGTVVLAGICGVCDSYLRPYANLGGPSWAALNWHAPLIVPDFIPAQFIPAQPGRAAGRAQEFRGAGVGAMSDAQMIADDAGHTVGWQRRWGKGKLVAYTLFPDALSQDAHPSANVQKWAEQLITLAALPIAGRWVNDSSVVTPGTPGVGSAVVEVVVRQKSPASRFVFCLNQGAAGRGMLEVPLSGTGWRAEDALTGKSVPSATLQNGVWRLPLPLGQFGYRIIHLVRP